MNTDNKSDLDEILWEFWEQATSDNSAHDLIVKAHSQIQALFMDCLPEKIKNWTDVDPKKIGERTVSSGNLGLYWSAHNQAISQAKDNFNKRLGRK